jgi:hypothetical protein
MFSGLDVLSVAKSRANPVYSAGNSMQYLPDHPRILFVVSFVALWLAAEIGVLFSRWPRPLVEDERENFTIVLSATLTLLGLIIGFSFSMATSRYDQRKNYEEEEANAIGTEYVRAGLLDSQDTERVQGLLKKYLAQRMLFYTVGSERLPQVNSDTAQLQQQMWSVVQGATRAKPSPVTALVSSGMNDVLNSQGYTQAAWWNRIPTAAWSLMVAIAICCNLLMGYGVRQKRIGLIMTLPFVLSIAFFLISDIDSPRNGVIRVLPRNLITLSQSLGHS